MSAIMTLPQEVPGLRARAPLFLAVAGLLLLAAVVPNYGLQLLTRGLILAIFAMSLDLLVGVTGLVSLGHAAFYGIAAYFLIWLAPDSQAINLLWSLPVAVAGCAALALVIGALALRTGGLYFIMVTLAFAQLVYYLIHDTPVGGGTDGVYLSMKPSVALFGYNLLDLDRVPQFYILCVTLCAGVYALFRYVLASTFGRALVGIRVNEHRMRSIGYSTYMYKLGAFMLAGAVAGIAGYLSACEFGFVNPEMLSWHLSGTALMMVILGGKGHFRGAVLGAFIFVLLEELLSNRQHLGSFAEHWRLSLGVIIVLVALFLPNGVTGLRLERRWSAR